MSRRRSPPLRRQSCIPSLNLSKRRWVSLSKPGVRWLEPLESSAETDSRTGLGIIARTPVRGVRKAVAANMTRSRSEIPEATVWVDVDATALVEMRASLKKTDPHNTPGLLAFIARFVTAGLKKYPELNTRIVTTEDAAGGESQEIVAFDGVNLGFAAQTDRGLMVPSVRNADKMSARELDAEIRRLTAVVREGKATPSELGSGTFTLNNYGVFGVDGSAAIINHPEVGILGLGRIIDKPWVVNGELAVRKVTELTLTFDHRVCDEAGGFLRYVADAIEIPGVFPCWPICDAGDLLQASCKGTRTTKVHCALRRSVLRSPRAGRRIAFDLRRLLQFFVPWAPLSLFFLTEPCPNPAIPSKSRKRDSAQRKNSGPTFRGLRAFAVIASHLDHLVGWPSGAASSASTSSL